MSRLFIELYFDEDVSAVVADLIRARGFSVTTTREAGRLGSSDAEQLAYAARQQKTFLTHNRADFESLPPVISRPVRPTTASSSPCGDPRATSPSGCWPSSIK